MPMSDGAVRDAAIAYIRDKGYPRKVLDLGVGYGFYGQVLSKFCRVMGVEIWPEYLKGLLNYYEMIFIKDIRHFDYETYVPDADLVVAADVLEHMTKEEAMDLVRVLKSLYPWLVITIPIQYCPQGAVGGNEHETHVYQWQRDEVVSDLGMELIKDCGLCGLYAWRRDENSSKGKDNI